MSDRQLLIGPFNRVEGDLEVRLDVRDGVVAEARLNSPLFRGFEVMLQGKDPRDALTITPRICGICSISQSTAAALALGDAAGLSHTAQGALASAILHGAENLADHVTHFTLFFMPDFARPAYADRTWHAEAVARFTAMEGSGARSAVEARAKLLHIVGTLGGKWPHTGAVQPGGVTRAPSIRDTMRLRSILSGFRRYLEDTLLGGPVEAFASLATVDQLMAWEVGDAGLFLRIAADLDLARLGIGPRRYLSYGAYPLADGRVTQQGLWDGTARPLDLTGLIEDPSHAWMLGEARHPAQGETRPDEDMRDTAYTWCKAPRLDGAPYETGALARQIVDGHPLALALADEGSVRARIAGRLLEIARTQLWLEEWVGALDPGASFLAPFKVPKTASGLGLVEAARGALGHWIGIEGGKIARYQIIAPTTWNFSPRDAAGVPGPLEGALEGVPVAPGDETPIAVQHVVRSFDPCMVCTVH